MAGTIDARMARVRSSARPGSVQRVGRAAFMIPKERCRRAVRHQTVAKGDVRRWRRPHANISLGALRSCGMLSVVPSSAEWREHACF